MSGTASIGSFKSCAAPKAAMMSVATTTPQRKRIAASRSFSIISMLRLALAEFGFEQERALGRDHGTGLQPATISTRPALRWPTRDVGRLKALGGFDEHHIFAFDRLHRLFGNANARWRRIARHDPHAQPLARS
jgi:hypothetical protein